MKTNKTKLFVALGVALAGAGCAGMTGPSNPTTFFVTSTSPGDGANLGGAESASERHTREQRPPTQTKKAHSACPREGRDETLAPQRAGPKGSRDTVDENASTATRPLPTLAPCRHSRAALSPYC